MKSRVSIYITAITLFALLAIPVRLAAQHNEDHLNDQKHHHYKLIDLGTLGGPNSFVPAGAEIVNGQGTLAGCADTPIPDPNYPNSNPLLGPDPFIFHAFQWQNGSLTDLGALPGVNSSCAGWVSGNGLIAGLSDNGAIDPLTGFPEGRAVLWKDGEPIDLGTLGGYESFSFGVNNRGQAVGTATNAIPDPFSCIGGTQCRAFLWENGVMQDLGTLGGPDSFAFSGINDRGQIVGMSYTNSTPNAVTGLPTTDPFLWENGKMIDLGTLGGTFGGGIFINNRGQVVGQSNLAGDLVTHGFFWERGVLTDLGSLFAGSVEVWWLTDVGEIVGSSKYPDGIHRHAFLWKNGVMADLGTLYPKCNSIAGSVAFGANSKEQIVGNSGCDNPPAFAAFLWENGGPMVDLNTLIPPNSGMQLVSGLGINEAGEIAGVGYLPNGDARAFLLMPCGEGDEGCGDNAEGAAAAQSSPATANQRPTTVTPANPALSGRPATMLDRLRSRWGQRYHLPGL